MSFKKDPHQPYRDLILSENQMTIGEVERMEGEGGHPYGTEGNLGPIVKSPPAPENESVFTPKTQPSEGAWADDTVEGGSEQEVVTPISVRGCNCNCPGNCPEDCAPGCKCAGHIEGDPAVQYKQGGMTPTGSGESRACNCSHPGNCPEECPPSCLCRAHTRNQPTYNISGDEP